MRREKKLKYSVTPMSNIRTEQALPIAYGGPLLTIVSINRNNAASLPRTLESLSEFRDDQRVECLFIDGASTDNSLSIAGRFYEPDKIISEPDTGIYNAMNKGLKYAKGKYVLWLNSGDKLKANAFEEVMPKLAASSSDLISFGLEMHKEGSEVAYTIWRPKIEDLPSHTLPHPTTFFNREAFLNISGYREIYKLAGDRDAILRLYFFRRSVEFVDKVIGIFYSGGASSGRLLAYENLKINRCFGVIGRFDYLSKYCKLRAKDFLSRFRVTRQHPIHRT